MNIKDQKIQVIKEIEGYNLLEDGWGTFNGKKIPTYLIRIAITFLNKIKINPESKIEACACPDSSIFIRISLRDKELEIYIDKTTQIEWFKINNSNLIDNNTTNIENKTEIKLLEDWINFAPIWHHPV